MGFRWGGPQDPRLCPGSVAGTARIPACWAAGGEAALDLLFGAIWAGDGYSVTRIVDLGRKSNTEVGILYMFGV